MPRKETRMTKFKSALLAQRRPGRQKSPDRPKSPGPAANGQGKKDGRAGTGPSAWLMA